MREQMKPETSRTRRAGVLGMAAEVGGCEVCVGGGGELCMDLEYLQKAASKTNGITEI